MKLKFIYPLAGLWLVILCVALWYTKQQKLVHFDPQGNLAYQASEPEFDTRFARLLADASGLETLTHSTLYHFSDDTCFCQLIAQEHISTVKQAGNELGYAQISIPISKITSELARYVPSVPSVAIVDTKGRLRYFGPYSTGMFCTQGNGLVEPFLATKSLGEEMLAGTVISDASGCYCNL